MLIGYIDKFDFQQGYVRGWTALQGSTQIPSIGLVIDDVVHEVEKPSLVRKDLQHITEMPAGFSLRLPQGTSSFDVVSGRVKVQSIADGTKISIPWTRRAKSLAYSDLISDIRKIPGFNEQYTKMMFPESEAIKKHGRFSQVLLPVGTSSQDGTAMIGKEGQLFLTGGSNDLRTQYGQSADVARKISDKWESLILERHASLTDLNYDFLQIIVPEKLTALGHLAPFSITGPTPTLTMLESSLTSKSYYLSGLSEIAKLENIDLAYRANDTHFSALGAQRVFASIVNNIDPSSAQMIMDVRIGTIDLTVGDLSKRFFDAPIFSPTYRPDSDSINELSESLILDHTFDPDKGFVGRRRIWKNANAPIQKKVVAFGNSFFGVGSNPGSLSWWSSRFFSEFHFVWSSEVDYEYLHQTDNVDVVLAQTVERFLPSIPKK